MEKTGLQRNWVRSLLTVLTTAVMSLIFCFSMEPAEQSDKTSGILARQMIRALYPEYDHYPETQQTELYDSIQAVVRKTAHFMEFAVLGVLLRLCLESWFGHRVKKSSSLSLAGLCMGILYACSDEFHQLMIEGRSGQWTDVAVDGSGALLGILLGTVLIKCIRRKYTGME